MNISNNYKSLLSIIALALALVGFYTIDFDTRQAGVVTLPDFNTDVAAAQDQSVNSLKDLNDGIVNIAESASPTVVTISATQTMRVPDNPLFRYFGEDMEAPERQVQGLGSGVIVSEDGYILTNNHVVENAEEIRIQTYDGTDLEAEIVGTDSRTDVAVLKVNADNLPAISFGDSDQLRIGEFVLAIGSPFQNNLAHSVSFGIVSGKGRSIDIIEQGGYESFIQTDAAINPGNSGGALINLDGELVGINTAIASRTGGSQGVGFAIPSNMTRNIMTQLIENGEVSRGYLGILGQSVHAVTARAFDLSRSRGVLIDEVENGTPADEAGLQAGDIILTLNGDQVLDYNSFRTDIAGNQPGTEVNLGIVRDGEAQDVLVTLGELPVQEPTASADSDDQNLGSELGFAVQNLTGDIASQLGLETDTEGVVVTNISPNSNAYRQGLRQGNVITAVAQQRVRNVSEFNNAISELNEEGDQAVLLRVISANNGQTVSRFIAFDL